MAYTTPKTWTSGSALTAAELNEQIRDNVSWIKAALAYLGVTSDSAYGQLKGATYGVRLYRGTNQALASGASSAINMTSETFDTNGLHHPSTNTERITIPTGGDGVYLVQCEVEFEAYATGDRRIYVTINGASTVMQGTEIKARCAASGTTALASSDLWVAAAGDYIQMNAFQNSSVSINAEKAAFSAVRLFAS